MNVLAAAMAAAAITVTLGCLRAGSTALAAAHVRGRLTPGAGGAGAWWRTVEREVPARLAPLVEDAALPIAAGQAWVVWVGGGSLLALAAFVAGGLGAAIIAGVAWVAVAAAVLVLRRGASGRAVDAALPHALEAVARSLRSGAGTHQALAAATVATSGPLGVELRQVCADVDAGRGIERALTSFEDRRPEPGVRLAVAALLLGAEAGGAHARALDGVAEGVRARLAVGAEVKALASQAQLSALVIATAPLAFTTLAAGADGATASFLFRTPVGLACLAGGLVLDGVGALWMHRIAQVEP